MAVGVSTFEGDEITYYFDRDLRPVGVSASSVYQYKHNRHFSHAYSTVEGQAMLAETRYFERPPDGNTVARDMRQ